MSSWDLGDDDDADYDDADYDYDDNALKVLYKALVDSHDDALFNAPLDALDGGLDDALVKRLGILMPMLLGKTCTMHLTNVWTFCAMLFATLLTMRIQITIYRH